MKSKEDGECLLNILNLRYPGIFGGSNGKESACNAGGSIPGLGRSAREGNGNALQYFCLENSMDRGFWQATVHGTRLSNSLSLSVWASQVTQQLRTLLPVQET